MTVKLKMDNTFDRVRHEFLQIFSRKWASMKYTSDGLGCKYDPFGFIFWLMVRWKRYSNLVRGLEKVFVSLPSYISLWPRLL